MEARILFDRTLTLMHNQAGEAQSRRYALLPVAVPLWCCRLDISVELLTSSEAQIPLCLYDARRRLRIMKASEGTVGAVEQTCFISVDDAGEGGIPGSLPEGEWNLVLYKRRFSEDIPARILVTGTIADPENPDELLILSRRNPYAESLTADPFQERSEAGTESAVPVWFAGELHIHSSESTGRTPVADILAKAKQEQLDFIAVTDHFTASHWLSIQALEHSGRPLILQSMEVSGDRGHANIHGISSWIDPLVDENEILAEALGHAAPQTMESVADAVHAQGGLFCINHPLSGAVSWRYHEFPLEKADLIDVWSLPDAAVAFLYPTLWDGLLCRGFRITGIGSSDSHHPSRPGPWELGQIRNWVLAPRLSRQAIIESLKAGRVYISIGPARMTFTAVHDSSSFTMGDTVVLRDGQSCELRVTLRQFPVGNLFFMANGMVHDIIRMAGGERESVSIPIQAGSFGRIADGQAFVRVEYHEELEPPAYWGSAIRDHRTLRLLSNPIWFKFSGS